MGSTGEIASAVTPGATTTDAAQIRINQQPSPEEYGRFHHEYRRPRHKDKGYERDREGFGTHGEGGQ